jgi:hypothetical protein
MGVTIAMKHFTLFILLILPTLLLGQEFSAPLRVNSNTSGSDNVPTMHVGVNGTIYISWIKSTGVSTTGDIYFTRSHDNGVSFMPDVQVTSGAKISPTYQRGASFGVDTKGNIHMVWMESRVNSQADIWYTRSEDDGNIWSTPVSVSGDSSLHLQDFSSIACDSSGNVYVSFIDSRDRENGNSTNEHLYMTKSSDGGATWSPAKRVDAFSGGMGGTCECCKQDIHAGKNGLVTITFRSNISDRRDIFVSRSTDFGETFAEALPLQTSSWMIQACPTTGPSSFLTGDGSLYTVWRDNRQSASGEPHVYLTRQYAEGGMFEGVAFDEVDESSPNWPDIVVSSGVQASVYETFDKGLKYVLYSPYDLPYYNNTQVHFNGNRQQFGGVEFGKNNERYIVWQEKRSTTQDIYFTKDTMPMNFSSVKNTKNSALRISPNPVRKGEQLSIRMNDATSYQYELVDIIGRVITSGEVTSFNDSFTVPNTASGSYFLRLSSPKGVATQMVIIGE